MTTNAQSRLPFAVRCAAPALLAVAIACAAAAQRGKSDRRIDAFSLEQLISELGDSEFKKREEATRELMTSPFTIEEILDAAQPVSRLDEEQFVRLDQVLEHRFRDSPRGAIGVRFDPLDNDQGVRIMQIVPGFPAGDQLIQGDIIAIADNVDLRRSEHPTQVLLPRIILSHDPGEMLSVSIFRDGRQLNMRIPLGNYGKFSETENNDGRPAQMVLEDAWEIRKKRIGFERLEKNPIKLGVEGQVWGASGARKAESRKVGFVAGSASRAIAERTFSMFDPEEAMSHRDVEAPGRPPLLRMVENEIDRRREIIVLQQKIAEEAVQQRALSQIVNDLNITNVRRLEARKRLSDSAKRSKELQERLSELLQAEQK